MPLPAGTKLGPYEIQAPIGSGGMGEVYKAQDPRLNRVVAVKVSQERFSERFEREARAVAALNHPNVCHLYDVGPNYLVMEMVEGPTLADRLKSGAIPLDESLALARQIAAALEAAHEKGIVHRDLKPGNIKITPHGTVKVLDFGLAKMGVLPDASSEESPTLSMAATQAGVILGTAAYMSPEQARGKQVDKRADIWAFGVVLFEMLTGRRLFAGEDISVTLASVIKQEPAWEAVPPRVRRLLRACLEKDAKLRLREIGDVWRLLEDESSHALAAPPASRSRAWIVAAGILLAAGAALAAWFLKPAPPSPALYLEITPPEGVSLGPSDFFEVALSPDGRRLVFFGTKGGKRMLWMRSLDSNTAAPIAGTEDAAGQPFWSPDSRWIAFAAGGKLQKINVDGGSPEVICDALSVPGNTIGSWSTRNVIVFMQLGKPLQQVSASGGAPTSVFPFDSARQEWAERDPYFLPDGKQFLYHSSATEAGIVLASVDGKSRRFLFPNSSSPASYAPNPAGRGWVLYIQQGQFFARPFDPGSGEFRGDPAPVAEGLYDGPSWSASATGLLAFPRSQPWRTTLTWFDRSGKRLGGLDEPGVLDTPRISPDQKAVAFARAQNQNVDIWIYDLGRGLSHRFTFEPGPDTNPVWSPDSSRLVYASRRQKDLLVVERPAGGIGSETVLYKHTATAANDFPTSVSPDGRATVLTDGVGNDRIALLYRPDGKFVPFLQNESEMDGMLSPDGRWILYSSFPAGRFDVFVQAVPPEKGGSAATTGKWQISNAGGTQAVWRADGKEIFYIALDGKMMAVPIESGPDFFRPGTPEPLFQTGLNNPDSLREYDVTRDGQRFLLNQPDLDTAQAPITVIANWPQLLRK